MRRQSHFRPTGPAAPAVLAAVVAGPVAAQPVSDHNFSIDAASPTVGNPAGPRGFAKAIQPGDVLIASVPMGPMEASVRHPRQNLALAFGADDLDGLSPNLLGGGRFFVLFSVDRFSVGAAGPFTLGCGFPFNVAQQAALNQAAGDVFVSTEVWNRNAKIAGLGLNNNTLSINQAVMSGENSNLRPNLDPRQFFAGPIDDLDAGGGVGDIFAATARMYFTLDWGSPSLGLLPGTGSAADVYIDFDPAVPGTEFLFAPPMALGLVGADNIDGLMVFDLNDDGQYNGNDVVWFSLDRASPTLGALGASPADVFRRSAAAGGALTLAQRVVVAADLGLDAALDNVDMIDAAPIPCNIGDPVCLERTLARHAVLGGANLFIDTLDAGVANVFELYGAIPFTPAHLFFGRTGYGPVPVPALGVTLCVKSPTFLSTAVTDAAGYATWTHNIPAAALGVDVWMQAAQAGLVSNVVQAQVQ